MFHLKKQHEYVMRNAYLYTAGTTAGHTHHITHVKITNGCIIFIRVLSVWFWRLIDITVFPVSVV